ncbi:hypothetical protein E3E31_02550 [Thermococcus sp. M39]|uniref:hypothetical protein n=1 Tax=unclassified Thermococcus TaxID=2627626 RepID=UPI00143BBF67|nr:MULTISPECIES: hypothetical protein [unclassified Thermococcus]NJE07424.1 hypothetical protein [Thermococcus sp. M39]NJE12444.1 hypothetical protein [Thermococcus sp. LS2]
MIIDQKTIRDSSRIAKVKQKEFLEQSKELKDFSKLETVIVLILGAIAMGFVIFVLKNYL